MRLALALSILFGALATADEPKKDEVIKTEQKKLEGIWEGYVVDGRGEKADRGPVHLRLTIKDSKISAVDLGNGDKDMGTGTFKIDPSKSVKEIDSTGVVLPGKRERTFLGIYELDGNTLKWCVDNRKTGRPTEFRTASGTYLLVLKRK